jgi:hypothetical protein
MEQEILQLIRLACRDGSMLVRVECTVALARAACVPPGLSRKVLGHHEHFIRAFQKQKERMHEDIKMAHMSHMLLYGPDNLASETSRHSIGGHVAEYRSRLSDTGVTLRGAQSDVNPSFEALSAEAAIYTGTTRSESGADNYAARKMTSNDFGTVQYWRLLPILMCVFRSKVIYL